MFIKDKKEAGETHANDPTYGCHTHPGLTPHQAMCNFWQNRPLRLICRLFINSVSTEGVMWYEMRLENDHGWG